MVSAGRDGHGREERPRATGVLATDQIGVGQDLAGPRREVAEIPDRGGHQHEFALAGLLHATSRITS
jgi:hypothetical protein